MSERGTISIDRGIFDHPMFAREPFTEREAWQWLIAEAAWKPHTRRIGHFQIDLKRGQVAASIRFLAEKWQWHRSKVDRFLERLKIGTMIGTRSETGITVITISNYDKYQNKPARSGTAEETASGTGARQERDKGEYKEEGNKRKKDAADAAPMVSNEETELFRRGKTILGENAGGLIKNLLKTKGNIALARAAIEVASTKQAPREYIGAIIRGHDPPSEQVYRW